MTHFHPYTIFPLGDSALTIDFGNLIDEEVNRKVASLFRQLRKENIPYIMDMVPAYSSLTVHYDLLFVHQRKKPDQTAFDSVAEMIETLTDSRREEDQEEPRTVEIPVCYTGKYAPDLGGLAALRRISEAEVIRLHTSGTYRVYMLGFLPGFAYMGEVDEMIAVPRRATPRPRVEAGSVGIAGKQTGIYPLHSPGGWQIIGRTPLKLFDQDSPELTLFRTGDQVRFYSISEHEFAHYKGRSA